MRRLMLGLATLVLVFAVALPGVAGAADLPSSLALPAGASVKGRVDYAEFAREDFSHATAAGAWEHPIIAGHTWRVFLAGERTALSVAAWKAALTGAGWQVLRETEGNLVARRADWWVKVGTDRLVLVQQVEAAAFTLTPPGDQPEALEANRDIAYAVALPGTKRSWWKAIEHFELTPKQDPELRLLGPAVQLRYEGAASLSALEIQSRYDAALQKAGWSVVRSDVAGIVGAHYTAHGRDVWFKLTPSAGSYLVEVADMGLQAAPDKLARAIAEQGHVALYGIYFDTDKSTLKPESQATLQQLLALLLAHPDMKLEVQGHTDSTSTPAHNQKLSEERAASVKAWLLAHQIDAVRLTTRGYAATQPVADNATAQGRALNRRVELAKP